MTAKGAAGIVVLILAAAAAIPGLASRAEVRGRGAGGRQLAPAQEGAPGLLKLMGIEPSTESIDYVQNKTQFQLHTLLTEQRHQKTWYLSDRVQKDTLAGLKMLSAVDDDIRVKLEAMAADTTMLDQAAAAVEAALLAKRRIYVYGCGATGRLAKQMESAF